VLQYLKDYRQQIADNIAKNVFDGSAPPHEWVKEAAMRCEIMGDICDLTAEDINVFYPEKEESNE
jgi:hypothetical protein